MTEQNAQRPLYGVNLPWFFGAYGHDLAPTERHPEWPCDFDAMRATRPMVEAREMGFRAVRVWLCENGEGIVTRDGRVEAVHPQLLDSVAAIQAYARLVGLRVYWTLLDGNSWGREGDTLSHTIVADAEQSKRFAERVVRPLARAFDPAVTLGVELINEPEAMAPECRPAGQPAVQWSELGRFLRETGDAVRTERAGTLVTAGTLHVFLPQLWRAKPALGAIDIHVYSEDCGLPSRADLARDAGDDALMDTALPLIAGECGVPDNAPEETRLALDHYLYNADSRAYAAVFLWRLEGIMVKSRENGRPLTRAGERLRAELAKRG